jgi:hypothetical protein
MAFEATFGAHLLAKEAEVRRARSGRSCRIGASARASDDGRCPPRRLALAAVVTGLIVAVLGLLAPTAGATAAPQPQTRVAAIGRPAGQLVGPHGSVLADLGRERALSYDRTATGSSVAAEGEVATTPAGRVYSWHYLNETGPLRNIPGSVVDETIDQATDTTQLGDRTIYYDAKNDITVVQSDTTGKIMSVRRGAP